MLSNDSTSNILNLYYSEVDMRTHFEKYVHAQYYHDITVYVVYWLVHLSPNMFLSEGHATITIAKDL